MIGKKGLCEDGGRTRPSVSPQAACGKTAHKSELTKTAFRIRVLALLLGLSAVCLCAGCVYLFSGTAAGYYSIVLIPALGVAVTWFRQSFLRKGFSAAMLCTAVATTVYEILVFAIGLFLGMTTAGHTTRIVNDILFQLTRASQLIEVHKSEDERTASYAPAYDIAQMTLYGVLHAVERYGDTALDFDPASDVEHVEQLLDRLADEALHSEKNPRLIDLI